MGRKKKNQDSSILTLEFVKNQEYTVEQKDFIEYDGNKSIILAATAGAGKTFSCVQRLKHLINNGVQPSRILFLSFTVAAAEELKKRIGRDDIQISTIHSLAGRILYFANKGKKIVSFYDFTNWYANTKKPKRGASHDDVELYEANVEMFYSEGDIISSNISAYKLELADGLSPRVPPFYQLYREFLREQKARDFSDMLIDAREALNDDRVLGRFKNQYDYIFVDEYQDTSAIQFEILLKLNAKFYYLIGDRNQMIYGYSGANCTHIENMLRERREVEEKSLTINFRSDKDIVENSNKYSSLMATASSGSSGYVDRKIILSIEGLKNILAKKGEVAVLARDNKTIKRIEEELLISKFPIRYFNFITPSEIASIRKGEIRSGLKHKIDRVKKYFDDNVNEVIAFIESNKSSNSFITSIHKSKGREFDVCVVVNSVSKEILEENGILKVLSERQLEKLSFQEDVEDNEEKNIHYVAVSRSKHELYFMIYG